MFISFGIVIILIIVHLVVGIDMIWAWLASLEDEAYIAMASGVIALIALGFAIVQGWQNHKHNKLSVLPLVSVMRDSSIITDINIKEDIHYKVILINQGVGPAIIKKFELLFDGESVLPNDADTYESFLDKKTQNFIGRNFGHRAQGSVIKVGEQLILWEFKYVKNQDISEVTKLGLKIEYQSIYRDETFRCFVKEIP